MFGSNSRYFSVSYKRSFDIETQVTLSLIYVDTIITIQFSSENYVVSLTWVVVAEYLSLEIWYCCCLSERAIFSL